MICQMSEFEIVPTPKNVTRTFNNKVEVVDLWKHFISKFIIIYWLKIFIIEAIIKLSNKKLQEEGKLQYFSIVCRSPNLFKLS